MPYHLTLLPWTSTHCDFFMNRENVETGSLNFSVVTKWWWFFSISIGLHDAAELTFHVPSLETLFFFQVLGVWWQVVQMKLHGCGSVSASPEPILVIPRSCHVSCRRGRELDVVWLVLMPYGLPDEHQLIIGFNWLVPWWNYNFCMLHALHYSFFLCPTLTVGQIWECQGIF